MFEAFDPKGPLRITAGQLPHWYQPGATYFVTFRTADSIPAPVAAVWYRHRDEWLRYHGIDPSLPSWMKSLQALDPPLQREFHSTFSREFLEHLDRGHGECLLRRPELAKLVVESLRHSDGVTYHLGDFVIMPNHVHLLVGLIGETDILRVCRSWKRFSATKINRALGRRGRFWQEESFDHLVRSSEHFERSRRYVEANPRAANLRPGESLHDRRPAD